MKVKCIKSLRKSTYNSLAFKSGKKYEVESIDKDFIFVKDEKGHSFNFSREASNVFYNFNDYFNGPVV